MKKLLTILFIGLFLITFSSAHKLNQDFYSSFNSENATSWNLTTINTPEGVNVLNIELENSSRTFFINLTNSNFTTTGNYQINLIGFNGVDYFNKEIELEVTPSGRMGNENTIFFIFVILLIYGITFFGFFGKNIPITILGGMAMIFLGVYIINQGLIIYQDNLTNYIAYLTIAVGAVCSLWAGLEQLEVL